MVGDTLSLALRHQLKYLYLISQLSGKVLRWWLAVFNPFEEWKRVETTRKSEQTNKLFEKIDELELDSLLG